MSDIGQKVHGADAQMSRRKWWIFVTAIWAVVVLAGLAGLSIYQGTPGTEGRSPQALPKMAPAVESGKLPELVMFAHPQCPCTRASIGELAVLMAQNQGRVAAKVLFVRPDGTAKDWMQTDLWKSAAAIPGVTVEIDDSGRAAREFQAATSGLVVLYDPAGKLLFQGGITDGRGHSGDNAGRDAITALIHGETPKTVTTPVYGCALTSHEPTGISSIWSR